MSEVRRSIILFWWLWMLIAIGIVACSTLSLPSGSTDVERHQALCRNAQFGYVLSTTMLEAAKPATPQDNAYWLAYRAGAALTLQTYCTGWTQSPGAMK